MLFYVVRVENEDQIYANPERSVANDRKWSKQVKRDKKREVVNLKLPPLCNKF